MGGRKKYCLKKMLVALACAFLKSVFFVGWFYFTEYYDFPLPQVFKAFTVLLFSCLQYCPFHL